MPVKFMPGEPEFTREYEVLSGQFVHGESGDVVTLTMTEQQEAALLASGAVKRAESPRPKSGRNKEG